MKLWPFLCGVVFLLGLVPLTEAQTDHMTLSIYLNGEGENVNTFGGTLQVPTGWDLEQVHLQSPEVIYWIEVPSIESKGLVKFSGMIPGGIQYINVGSEAPLLFSLDFSGENLTENSSGLSFFDTAFYLNHPAALEATSAHFETQLSTTDAFKKYYQGNSLSSLHYSFEEDPITHQPALVINSLEGDLASYRFLEKEGDFGIFSGWMPVDGMQVLNSTSSTVSLNVLASDGTEQTMLLRSSLLRHSLYVFVGILFGLLAIYLFKSALAIFQVDLPLNKKMK
jgi:hypothetical protein